MNKYSEMVIFDSNMLRPGSELRTGSNFDAALIVFPYFAFEYWSVGLDIKTPEISFNKLRKWMTSRIAVDKAIYSLYVVLSAISV